MKKLLSTFITCAALALCQTGASAQTTNFHKYVDLQSNAVTRAIDFDGNDFILTGFFKPGVIGGYGNANDRIHLTRLDNNLNVLWNKTYVTQNEYDNRNLGWTRMRAYDVKPTMDGGYIVCGEQLEEGVTNNPFLMKTDGNGAVQWFKLYWGTDRGCLNSVIETPNGDFITCGYGIKNASTEEYARVMKTDNGGGVQWTKEVYGNMLNSNNEPYHSRYNEVIQYSDDSYALVGVCNNYFFLSITDVLVTVVNDGGGTVSNWIYGIANDSEGNHINEYGKSIVADGSDLIVAGTYDAVEPGHCFSNYTDFFVFKVDNSGSLIFSKRYDIGGVETASQVTLCNGNITVLGDMDQDAFLADLDINNGAPIAGENYNYNTRISSHSLVLDGAGDVRFVGNTPNLVPTPGDYDWVYLVQRYAGHYQHCNDWVTGPDAHEIDFDRPDPTESDASRDELKIDVLDFDIHPDEHTVCTRDDGSTPAKQGSLNNGPQNSGLEVEAQPNPVLNLAVIRYSISSDSRVNLGIYDQSGRLIEKLLSGDYRKTGTYSVEFDASKVPNGSYILKLEAGSSVMTAPLIIVR